MFRNRSKAVRFFPILYGFLCFMQGTRIIRYLLFLSVICMNMSYFIMIFIIGVIEDIMFS